MAPTIVSGNAIAKVIAASIAQRLDYIESQAELVAPKLCEGEESSVCGVESSYCGVELLMPPQGVKLTTAGPPLLLDGQRFSGSTLRSAAASPTLSF